MLERVWRKRNSPIVLLQMQSRAATVENSMEVSQKKLKIELVYDSAIPLLGIYQKKKKKDIN